MARVRAPAYVVPGEDARLPSAASTSQGEPHMWLEAILTREDLQDIAARFAPLELRLGDNGSLLLVEPREVALIADRGIALKCDATLHWPVLGFDVPVSLHGLTVLILPSVEDRPDGATLVFRLQIDHAGVAMLPSFFDHGVTARLNQELEAKHVELAWNFVDTLSHVFKLPPSLASAAAFSIKATAGRVKATETALGLAVDFEAAVKPRGEAAAPTPSSDAREEPPDSGRASANGSSPRIRGVAPRSVLDSRSLVLGAAGAWLLLAGMRAVGGMGRRRARWRT
jgi:hypothetical protein